MMIIEFFVTVALVFWAGLDIGKNIAKRGHGYCDCYKIDDQTSLKQK